MAPKSLDQNIEDFWVWKCLVQPPLYGLALGTTFPWFTQKSKRRSEAVISVVVSIEDLWVSWDIKEDIQEMQSKETKEGHKLTSSHSRSEPTAKYGAIPTAT